MGYLMAYPQVSAKNCIPVFEFNVPEIRSSREPASRTGEASGRPPVLANPQRDAETRAGSGQSISTLVDTYRAFKKVQEGIQESQDLLLESDEEMRELAKVRTANA